MPPSMDQLAVERAALGLAGGDSTADWLRAQDAKGSDGTWTLVKIVMRAVALFLSIALLVLTIIALDLLVLPVAVLATVWNATEFLTMGIRRDYRRGVTPKAHVGADLVLWICAGYTFGRTSMSISLQLHLFSYISSLLGAETAFACLLLFLHFVLFVRACVEVDRQKKSRRIQKLVLALQGRDRRGRGAEPAPRTVAVPSETYPPKGSGADTAGVSEASLFSHRAPPSSAGSPAGVVDPRALNAKYHPEAMKLVRELDVLDAQKVLGNRRDVDQ